LSPPPPPHPTHTQSAKHASEWRHKFFQCAKNRCFCFHVIFIQATPLFYFRITKKSIITDDRYIIAQKTTRCQKFRQTTSIVSRLRNLQSGNDVCMATSVYIFMYVCVCRNVWVFLWIIKKTAMFWTKPIYHTQRIPSLCLTNQSRTSKNVHQRPFWIVITQRLVLTDLCKEYEKGRRLYFVSSRAKGDQGYGLCILFPPHISSILVARGRKGVESWCVLGMRGRDLLRSRKSCVSCRRWRPISPTRRVPWGQDTSMYQTYHQLFITPVSSPPPPYIYLWFLI
jgi:hypothetical protein